MLGLKLNHVSKRGPRGDHLLYMMRCMCSNTGLFILIGTLDMGIWIALLFTIHTLTMHHIYLVILHGPWFCSQAWPKISLVISESRVQQRDYDSLSGTLLVPNAGFKSFLFGISCAFNVQIRVWLFRYPAVLVKSVNNSTSNCELCFL